MEAVPGRALLAAGRQRSEHAWGFFVFIRLAAGGLNPGSIKEWKPVAGCGGFLFAACFILQGGGLRLEYLLSIFFPH